MVVQLNLSKPQVNEPRYLGVMTKKTVEENLKPGAKSCKGEELMVHREFW